ncbi:MAG: response regulator [Planctomycetota bacterium]
MNSNTVIRFSRSCPTCGRRMKIESSLLGRVVACRHCKAEFTAMACDDGAGQFDDAQRLMERVDSMLSQSLPKELGVNAT